MASLDWKVEKIPLSFRTPEGEIKDFQGKYITRRSDTGDPLGVVGEVYEVIQNQEAFAFFDFLKGSAEFVTAGQLWGGKAIWATVKFKERIKLYSGKDVVDLYGTFLNYHNGMGSVSGLLLPVREVCTNGLNVIEEIAKSHIAIRHTPSYEVRMDMAKQVLAFSAKSLKQIGPRFEQMSLKKLSNKELISYVEGVIFGDKTREEVPTHRKNVRDEILVLHDSGRTVSEAKGTLWGAYNAVTEYADHVVANNSEKALLSDRRIASSWFGTGAKLKRKALWEAVRILNN